MRYREALSNASCPNCGGPTAIGEMSFDEHHLRLENARLREEVHYSFLHYRCGTIIRKICCAIKFTLLPKYVKYDASSSCRLIGSQQLLRSMWGNQW